MSTAKDFAELIDPSLADAQQQLGESYPIWTIHKGFGKKKVTAILDRIWHTAHSIEVGREKSIRECSDQVRFGD